MARTWLIDSRGIARKVKNASHFSTYQIKDSGANRECPNCHHIIDNSDVSHEWPGLPAGVKFDPSDVELLEHLAGKVGLGNSKPHLFIDEFIPTLEGDEGICYTHPENLPGSKKDGSCVHFFHRTTNAYATGKRKRRKIHGQCSLAEDHGRWHKTGKTKAVLELGVQKGHKKIMVLYKSSKKGSKPDKFNWVMHQYHLGTEEDEKKGEYVVSKIFYQQQSKKSDKIDIDSVIQESDTVTVRVSPRTPKTKVPRPPRHGKCAVRDENVNQSSVQMDQEAGYVSEAPQPAPPTIHLEEEGVIPVWWAGESQAIEDPDPNDMDDLLLCNEIIDSYPLGEVSGSIPCSSNFGCSSGNALKGDIGTACGIPDLDNIELDTPPDFQLADLQFGSENSIMSWLDWF